MNEPTRQRLIGINRDFYTHEADSFASSRDHPWPGWVRVVDALEPGPLSVLDAGCGNGRLARFLQTNREIRYVGVDTSSALIDAARMQNGQQHTRFEVCEALESPAGPFDLIAVFGLMHHVPGFAQRVELLASLAARLAPAGRLAATFWRFGVDPRFEERLQDWGEASFARELEPGDHLLRWGESDGVVRYCHFADDEELDRIVGFLHDEGLTVVDRFRSDGRGGALNEYLVWSPG